MGIFNSSKEKFKSVFKQILKEGDNYAIGEAALPAYSHKNPIIDWLFWKRIKVAFNYSVKKNNTKNVLDFGCGSGILSYMLAQNGLSVTACDIEFGPLKLVQDKITFPANVDFVEGDILSKNLAENSFDIIFAMDVLEHIDDLEPYIELFESLLKPDGVVVVSGPTENVFYKLGRKFAGNRFTGDYHVTNISKIKNAFNKRMKVKSLKKLFFPIILFEIFISQKK